jgi:rfaE bifunctional protein kinase chain/domain
MRASFPPDLAAKATALLPRFRRLNLLVAGDFVADESLFGVTERISREAPVLILRLVGDRTVPGGAGNAANNAAELGARVFPLSVLGDDEQGRRLARYFRDKRVDVTGLLTVKHRPTPVKTRILAGAHHTAKQQVLRIDRVEDREITRMTARRLIARLTALAPRMDALLVSDYHLGVLTEAVRRALLSEFEGRVVVADSRSNLPDYRGVTLVTPNVEEAGSAAGIGIVDDASLLRAGDRLREKLRCQVLITRGPHGMSLFDSKGAVRRLPVHGADQPVDPTGAGDTVAATATLALAAGADLVTAASLAAVAAGIVVAQRGTVTVTHDELVSALKDSFKRA